MGLIDTQVRTITCNGTECTKTITFDRRLEKQTFDTPGNEWLKSVRIVQTVDARNLVYCSDACEVKGAATGAHNLPEPKRLIEGAATQQAIDTAANAARLAEQATAALKAGGPVTLG